MQGNFTVIMDKAELDGSHTLKLMVGPFWPFCLGLTTNLVFTIPLIISIVMWNVVEKWLIVVLILGVWVCGGVGGVGGGAESGGAGPWGGLSLAPAFRRCYTATAT